MALGAQSAQQTHKVAMEVPIEHRLFLNLDEAQSFTGLSRGILYKAIKAGQLPAKIMGRGWRIKRADLESYAAQMSMEPESVEPVSMEPVSMEPVSMEPPVSVAPTNTKAKANSRDSG